MNIMFPILLFLPLLSIGQCICPGDDQPPYLISFTMGETVNCDVEFLTYQPAFSDNCDTELQIELAIDTVFIDASRWLRSAEIAGQSESQIAMTLMLPGLQDDYRIFELDYGNIQYQLEQGTAVLEGHLMATDDSVSGFEFHLELEGRMSASEWLNQSFPTSYKDDLGVVEDEYLYWDYYLLSPMSFITGTGRYQGSYASLSHAPPNSYYAWQEGVLANQRSLNNGCGGWAIANGVFYFDEELLPLEEPIFPANFYFDLEDCLIPEYTLTWTATDNCGNSTSYTQVLTVSSDSSTSENCLCGVFGCINENAHNYNPTATLPNGQCYGCTGDFNGDGYVNSGDLMLFLADFGCTSNCDYDLNGDGFINTSDLLTVLEVFGKDCN